MARSMSFALRIRMKSEIGIFRPPRAASSLAARRMASWSSPGLSRVSAAEGANASWGHARSERGSTTRSELGASNVKKKSQSVQTDITLTANRGSDTRSRSQMRLGLHAQDTGHEKPRWTWSVLWWGLSTLLCNIRQYQWMTSWEVHAREKERVQAGQQLRAGEEARTGEAVLGRKAF